MIRNNDNEYELIIKAQNALAERAKKLKAIFSEKLEDLQQECDEIEDKFDMLEKIADWDY